MAQWHMVLIKFHVDTSQEEKQRAFDLCHSLGDKCGGVEAGILFWRVGWNLDLRKGIELVELSQFKDDDALQAFRQHPAHLEFAEFLREIADWSVGDIPA